MNVALIELLNSPGVPDSFQNLFWRPHPIHRNGLTIFSRTNDAQRPVRTIPADHLDFVAIDKLAAAQAIPFVFERMPGPIFIQTLQNLQLIFIHNLIGERNWPQQARMPKKRNCDTISRTA